MVASNNAINNAVGATISGVTNTFTVQNPSNTASSAARATITVGGGSSADPTINFNVSGVTDFEMGIDNNASDSFKIAASTELGTTDTFVMTTSGERTMPLQPAFLGILEGSDANATGDGTQVTLGAITALTEIFDQGSDFTTAGVFTAPVTGRYYLSGIVEFSALGVAHNQGQTRIDTSNREYTVSSYNPYATLNPGGGVGFLGGLLCEMEVGDTAILVGRVGGGAQTVTILGSGAGNGLSFFSGYLAV